MAPAPIAALFVLFFDNPVTVASLQAQYPTGVQMAPNTALVVFGMNPAGSTTPPYMTVPPPFASQSQYDRSVASGTVPGSGYTDQFGHTYPDNAFYWVGIILLQGPTQIAPPIPPPIGVRRWAIGFETAQQGEFALNATYPSRAASRHLDAYGYAYRARVINDGVTVQLPLTTKESWERIYFRIRVLPTGSPDMLWSALGSSDTTRSMTHLDVNPSGTLTLYNRGGQVFPGTAILTTGVIPLNKWQRADVHIKLGATGGSIEMWLNGADLGNFAFPNTSPGLGVNQNHADSCLGNVVGDVTTHGLEVDFDDWINSDFINVTIGTKCLFARATGYAATHNPAWVGDWRALLATIAESALATDCVATQVASAQMEITTDLPIPQNVASISISVFNRGVNGGGNGQLGYRGPTGPVLQTAALAPGTWSRAIFTAPGTKYIDPGLFSVIFIKDPSGAAGNAFAASQLAASVELAGTYGPEDISPGSQAVTVLSPTRNGIHNSPYPTIAAALAPTSTPAPVSIFSGTYVGNSFGQDIVQQNPAHWWWVRAVGGDVDGVFWFSTMDTAHGYIDEVFTPDRLYRALQDPTASRFLKQIAGADAQANQNGVTYQFIAVADPGQRFLLNGAFRHVSTLGSAINTLIDPAFTPEAGFFFNESASAAVGNGWFKGVGHAPAEASPLDNVAQATVATLAAGVLTSKTPIHNVTAQIQTAFSLWRRVDPSGYTGLFDLTSYVGNGVVGTRNIPVFPNIPGSVPFFALVTPHNGASFFRDPAHQGTNSHLINTGNQANNGIVGFGVNQVQVGSSLNANGVTYDVFVLPGGPVPEFYPVPPGGYGFGPPPPPPSPSPPPVPPPQPTDPPIRGGCYPLSQFWTDLGSRLGDPGHTHWTTTELTRYLWEALRTYNAFTQNYRNRASFTTTVFQSFYDLPTVIPTLRAYNVADRDLVTDIEYALMEPPTPTAWSGTVQFDLTTVAACLQRRRDQFLKETEIVLTREVVSTTVPASGRNPLPIDVLGLRRVAWVTPAGVVTPLKRDDEWSLTSYARSWRAGPANPAAIYPTVYSTGVTPPLTTQIGPVPVSPGFLDILAIVLGNVFTPNTKASLVGVPDDWTWVVKWGALADLLSQDGLGKDPLRAAYCEARWEQGLALATQASVVLNGEIGSQPQRLYSVTDGDSYQRTWQTTPGTPTKLFTAGHNILALAKPPDPNNGGPPYTVTLDVVANMPVPVAPTDCLNVGIDLAELDIIYDYVEHLALFKEGPGELQAAMGLLDRFTRACGITVMLDTASTPDRQAIFGQTTQDSRVHPRSVPDPMSPPIPGTGPA